MPRQRWWRKAWARTPASAIWTTPSASCAKLPCVPANGLAEIEKQATSLTFCREQDGNPKMDRADDAGVKPPALQPQLSRRAFVVGSLAAGFALAVMPVSADTITTDSNGLVADEVKIPVEGGEIPAYRAMPASGGPFPTVLVVHEIFGVHEHIKDICRRLAKLGYFAVAPELYARQGDVSQLTDFKEIFAKVVSKVPDAQVLSDLDAAVAWAKESGKGDTAKLAVTGFCWGGRIVWLYAAHSKDLKAGVAWYGRLITDKDDLHPKNP